jgi:prephenate dehydrogenase
MAIRQITIIGCGLIGGSLGLALKKQRFPGRIVGCDRAPVLERARAKGVLDHGETHPGDAARGSQIIILATPVGNIIETLGRLGPAVPVNTLFTDVGSTKVEILAAARKVFGPSVGKRFLGGHPMAGKEQAGVEYADADLFQGTAWLFTPVAGQNVHTGLSGQFIDWVNGIGARVASMDAEAHDQLCAWISHVPQMISTALAATLVEQYGDSAPLMEAGGQALREMTRISGSPYSMWRDIALTNKKNIQDALLKLEQHLTHIRENLDTRELALEFEQAHHLRKVPLRGKKEELKPD